MYFVKKYISQSLKIFTSKYELLKNGINIFFFFFPKISAQTGKVLAVCENETNVKYTTHDTKSTKT